MLRKYLRALCTGLLALHAPGPRLLVLARLQPLLPALLLLLAHQGPAVGSDLAGQSSCRAGEELQLNNANGSRAICIWRMQSKSFNHASCCRRCPLDAQYCAWHTLAHPCGVPLALRHSAAMLSCAVTLIPWHSRSAQRMPGWATGQGCHPEVG